MLNPANDSQSNKSQEASLWLLLKPLSWTKNPWSKLAFSCKIKGPLGDTFFSPKASQKQLSKQTKALKHTFEMPLVIAQMVLNVLYVSCVLSLQGIVAGILAIILSKNKKSRGMVSISITTATTSFFYLNALKKW